MFVSQPVYDQTQSLFIIHQQCRMTITYQVKGLLCVKKESTTTSVLFHLVLWVLNNERHRHRITTTSSMLWPNRLDDLRIHSGRLNAQIFLFILLAWCLFFLFFSNCVIQQFYKSYTSGKPVFNRLNSYWFAPPKIRCWWQTYFFLLSSVIWKSCPVLVEFTFFTL